MTARARPTQQRSPRWLFALPAALLATAVLLDLIDLATGTGAFNVAAYWMIGVGVVAGLVTAALRLWERLRSAEEGAGSARRRSLAHAAGHAAGVALFAASWLLRSPEAQVSVVAQVLSLGGLGLLLATASLASRQRRRLAAEVDASRGAPMARQPGPEPVVRTDDRTASAL